MSSIQKQSILFSLFSYAGVVLGFITTILLYPKVLSVSEYGLVNFIIVASSLLGIVGQAGMPSTVIRFFPYFKNKASNHGNLLSFVLLGTFIASTCSLFLTFLLENTVIQIFSEEESVALSQKYYWLIYAMMPFLAAFNLLCSYSFNFQKTAITAFFRDVFIKLATIFLLVICYLEIINFDLFIRGLTCAYWLQTLGMIIYLNYIGEFNLSFDFSAISSSKLREIFRYSSITMLTGSTLYLVNSIDQIMVSFFSDNQLADAGVFRVFFYLGVVISVPYKALLASSMSVISVAFKENNLNQIASFYKRTSLIMIGIGVFLFIAVVVNLDNIVAFIGPEYEAGKFVAVFIGLNALFNIASSVNGVIISQSKIYQYDLYLNLGLVVFNVILNYFLIKTYGLVGAAIATCITGVLYNVLKVIVVQWKFKMQPFSYQSLLLIILGMATLALNTIIPNLSNWFFDAIYRTIILALVYGGILLYFQLVPDLNNTLKKVFKRIG